MNISPYTKKKLTAGGLVAVLVFSAVALGHHASADTTTVTLPSSDGAFLQWTPSTGTTHYTLVNESSCNGTTNYVRTTTVGNRDSYGVSLASIPDGASISAISITPCASRDASGGANPVMNVFYRWNGANSSDVGAYGLSGTTPTNLATTTISGLALAKTSSSTLEIGAVLTSGTKGARLSRIAVVITYSPAPVPPTVTTNAATFVAATSSVLNGSSNPNGFATTAWFRFSSTNPGTCDNSFGTRVPSSGGTALGAGTSSVAFSNGTPTLATGTTYYYCAIASSTGGIVFGNIVSFTTLNPSVPPAAPSFLTLLTWSTSTPPEVFVNWIDNSNNETGFNVERGTDGINFTLIATTTFNSPHFTDIVSTGSSYYYRVQAFNAFGTSSYSNVASTTL